MFFCFRSVGCILYTLLVGKPPFETQTLKDTYARIKKNEYHIPSRVGPLAKKLISKLLQVIILQYSDVPKTGLVGFAIGAFFGQI